MVNPAGESLNLVQSMVAKTVDQAAWSRGTSRLGAWLNPVTGSPSAPLSASALIDSYGPSLMPRTSVHQGVVAGLNVLAAEAVQTIVEAVTTRVLPPGVGLPAQLAVRAATGLVGVRLGALPEAPNETLYAAAARSTGRLLTGAALGGAMYDAGKQLQRRIHRGARCGRCWCRHWEWVPLRIGRHSDSPPDARKSNSGPSPRRTSFRNRLLSEPSSHRRAGGPPRPLLRPVVQ